MKKQTLIGITVGAICAIGAAFGITALAKKGKNEDGDCEAESDEETYEEVDSDGESEE